MTQPTHPDSLDTPPVEEMPTMDAAPDAATPSPPPPPFPTNPGAPPFPTSPPITAAPPPFPRPQFSGNHPTHSVSRIGCVFSLVCLALLLVAGILTAVYFSPKLQADWQQRQLTEQADRLTAAAITHLNAGRHDEAIQVAQEALQQLPDYPPAVQVIATAENQRNILRQRAEAAANSLAEAEKLAAADDLPAAMDAFAAIVRNPTTPASIAKQAEQRRAELRTAKGTLSLPENWPDDAILRLDDKVQQTHSRTISGIPLGKHTVAITRTNHRPQPLIVLKFHGTRPVQLPEIKWVPVGGKVVITSTPAGAAVWQNGNDTGKTTPCTFEDVNVGKISYQLKLAGHFETEVAGQVETAATLELTASLPLQPRFPAAGTQAGERQEFNLSPTLRIPFRWCPPGQFVMGGTDPAATAAEKPVRTVRHTQGFWLAETELTQQQWQGLTGEPFVSLVPSDARAIGRGPDFPMYFVSWDKLCGNNARSGGVLATINGFLSKHSSGNWVVDLPTEAQWEYACRAGSTAPFGTVKPGADGFNQSAWHRANSGGQTHPVATKEANPWGLHDLHGNVAEWCRDWFQESYANLADTDPLGPSSGWQIVVRGGSCQSPPALCRSSARLQAYQSVSSALIGIRLALRQPDPPQSTTAKPAPKPAAKPPAKKPTPTKSPVPAKKPAVPPKKNR